MSTLEIRLNGKPFEVSATDTVADLVRALGLPGDGRGVAVALAGAVLPQAAWDAQQLAADAHVEILIASQGG